MTGYLLIESRDPFESNDVGYYYGLARGLVEAGNQVTLFLIQNAVLAARPSAQAPQLRALIGSGIKVLADDFALKERGITKLLDGDPPYESENLTTAFRILDVMARRGHNINVFAYEGASGLAFARQAPHPNPVHGKNVAEENHPTTKDQVTALLALAAKNGGRVDWVNCGMCVDERGVGEFVAHTRRGSPADFHSFCEASDNVLAIPTK